jgi:hypothetical protein
MTIGPEITISPTQVNCKTTSQLMLAKMSIFSSKRFNNFIAKPVIYHIFLGDLKFNLVHKIIEKVIKK